MTSALLMMLCGCAESAVDDSLIEPPDATVNGGALDSGLQDSGNSPLDAEYLPDAVVTGFVDATLPDGATGDAATAKDAAASPSDGAVSSPDAAATPADGGVPDASARDASAPDASSTGCDPDTCKNSCGISAPARCCKENDTCGCSWAPGFYCS